MKITKSRLKQIIKEELTKTLNEEVESIDPAMMRSVRDADKRSFFSETSQDLESVAAAMLGYRMIDHTNPAKVKTATQMADPKDVLLLGVTPEHIYFKTMDDIYYRIPRPVAALNEAFESWDDSEIDDNPHEFVLDELVTAAVDAVGTLALKKLQAANALNTVEGMSSNDIILAIEEPLMDALTPLAITIHHLENE